MVQFGESVLFKIVKHNKDRRFKGEPGLKGAVWFGIDSVSGESIVAREGDVSIRRSIKRHVKVRRCDVAAPNRESAAERHDCSYSC